MIKTKVAFMAGFF